MTLPDMLKIIIILLFFTVSILAAAGIYFLTRSNAPQQRKRYQRYR